MVTLPFIVCPGTPSPRKYSRRWTLGTTAKLTKTDPWPRSSMTHASESHLATARPASVAAVQPTCHQSSQTPKRVLGTPTTSCDHFADVRKVASNILFWMASSVLLVQWPRQAICRSCRHQRLFNPWAHSWSAGLCEGLVANALIPDFWHIDELSVFCCAFHHGKILVKNNS